MKFKWDQFTAFRLVFPFLLGIIAAVYHSTLLFHLAFMLVVLSLFLSFVGYVLLQILPIRTFSIWRMGSGLLMFVFMFSLGIVCTERKQELNQAHHFGHFLSPFGKNLANDFLVVQLTEPIVPKTNSYKATVKVLEVLQDSLVYPSTGHGIVYFAKNDSTEAPSLSYGDLFLVKNNFSIVKPPHNPEQFDFQRYLFFQNIYHQAFLKEKEWRGLGLNRGSRLMIQVYQWREYFLSVLTEKVGATSETAVAAALLLGYKHLLEGEIQAIYQDTGAMHVLAVSGLHVGIVMTLLGFIFSPINRLKYGAVTHLLLLLLGLWAFALLTGMAPSVFRSSVTFSLLAIGKHSNRNVSSLNIVAASAGFLLFLNPLYLFQVGFQLSYMAVIAIIYLYPKFTDPFQIENKWLRWTWQMSAVSIAATIGTLPLTLHYFNQFPVYFLLSNLIVGPAAYVLIALGIALFALGFIPYLGDFLGILLNWCIWLLNRILVSIQNLPFSVADQLYMPQIEMWFAYLFILFILVYFRAKTTKLLYVSLLCLCALFFNTGCRKYEVYTEQALRILQVKRQTAIEFQSGQSSLVYASEDFKKDTNKQQYTLAPIHTSKGLSDFRWLTPEFKTQQAEFIAIHWPFIQFDDKKMLLIDQTWEINYPKNECGETTLMESIYLDYLILCNNQYVPLDDLLDIFEIGTVVIDDSNHYFKIKYWTELLDKQGIEYHITKKKGAFIDKF